MEVLSSSPWSDKAQTMQMCRPVYQRFVQRNWAVLLSVIPDGVNIIIITTNIIKNKNKIKNVAYALSERQQSLK